MLSMLWVVGHGTYFMTAVGQKIRRLSFDSVDGTAGATWRRPPHGRRSSDGLATAAQLIAVLQAVQLEEAMKARQGGGGAKSGRYMKHDTARLRCLKRVIYPDLCMGKLPSATNAQMLFEMPGPREITGPAKALMEAWTIVFASDPRSTAPVPLIDVSVRPGAHVGRAVGGPRPRGRQGTLPSPLREDDDIATALATPRLHGMVGRLVGTTAARMQRLLRPWVVPG